MKKFTLSLLILSLTTILMAGCGTDGGSTDDGGVGYEGSNPLAVLKTTHGEIRIELFEDKTPETVKNFITHAEEGRYEDVPFHRVIEDFMIQGGDFENKNGTGGYSYKGPGTYLEEEFHDDLSHVYGAVSMANAGKGTGGSQFFIVQKEEGTDWLDGNHTIFGQALDMTVVEKIATLPTASGDKPLEDVLIESVKIIQP